MDDYRRRPTMEGFSRPGSLGGELTDDDSVEGHIMDDRKQDQDTEGHANWLRATEDDDTEGHAAFKAPLKADDDTEGHGRLQADDDDDTEGHGRLQADDDDDTEGHAAFKAPLKADDDDDTEGHAANLR